MSVSYEKRMTERAKTDGSALVTFDVDTRHLDPSTLPAGCPSGRMTFNGPASPELAGKMFEAFFQQWKERAAQGEEP